MQMERAACGIHNNHCDEIGVNSCTLLGEKYMELIHELASLNCFSCGAQMVSLVPILLSLPVFYL